MEMMWEIMKQEIFVHLNYRLMVNEHIESLLSWENPGL